MKADHFSLETTTQIRGGSLRIGTDPATIPALKRRYGVTFPGVFESETPAYSRRLDPYWMDRYPVTNAQFAAFVAAQPQWRSQQIADAMHNGRYLAHWSDGHFPNGEDDHPVVFVTWQAAHCYCRWAGGRLPTEAEWEYGARCGDKREFPWGDAFPSPKHANYGVSGLGTTTPVGSYPGNEYGLFDMAGNVWEWLLDAWQPTYFDAADMDPLAGAEIAEADLATIQGRRVIRGGSFAGAVVNLRTRWRDSHVVTNAVEFVGFRCAYDTVAVGS